MPDQSYTRDQNGIRLDLAGGMITYLPPDLVPTFTYIQNCRRLLMGRTRTRPALSNNMLAQTLPAGITSLVRMNDASPSPPAPSLGYSILAGITASGPTGSLYVFTQPPVLTNPVATGLDGNPLSFVIFRPNASPEPWCYVADAAPSINLHAPTYPSQIFGCPIPGMFKVRSDGLTFKTGIAEPQMAPTFAAMQSGPNNYNWVMYRYVYRSSLTGAVSNPSPETDAAVMLQSTLDSQIAVQPSQAGVNPGFSFNEGVWEPLSGTYYVRTQGSVGPGTDMGWLIQTQFPTANPGWGNFPANTPVQGVEVTMYWSGDNPGTGMLTGASLYYQNIPIGTKKSPGVSNFKSDSCGTAATDPWSGHSCALVLGGPNDTWGASLDGTIVNDPSFGVGINILTQQSGSTVRTFVVGFAIKVYYTPMTSVVQANQSPDPQVDKIDFYRMTAGLDNFTYVGTVNNDSTQAPGLSTGLSDTLSDLAVAANPILEFDNFEPFPSIDLPRKGYVNVVSTYNPSAPVGDPDRNPLATEIQWDSAGPSPNAPFNPRWLPGNVILIGGRTPQDAATAYTLRNRPNSNIIVATNLITDPTTGLQTFQFPPVASGVTYEISEPSLAAEPSPVVWGPTAPVLGSYYFGLDPLNPGDLLWSKGNNFDSAPDTNRMYVTSPSEPLQNGVITAEINLVFSTERSWLINQNFADAVAAVTGTEGSQWQLTQSATTRGLYMRYAICALGATVAFRAKDCIAISMGGGQEQSITDSIHNLFPHGGNIPQPVTIGGYTVYPPDDTKPRAQTMAMTPILIFYNYQDTTGTPRTLVYDIEGKGWFVDVYNPLVNCHHWTTEVMQLLTGCQDGTVRQLTDDSSASNPYPPTEQGTCVLITKSENGGDARANKRVGDVFFKGEIAANAPVTLQFWATQFTKLIPGGYQPTTIPAGSGPTSNNGSKPPYYIVDFTSGFAQDVDDIGVVLTWPLGSATILDLWQPDWIMLPETVQDRPSDWIDGGNPGNKYLQGFLLECDTFGQPKTFQVESDTGILQTPVECPFTQNGEAVRSFTLQPPLVGHQFRIVSSDGVPWRFGPSGGWDMQLISQPYPESSTAFTTEFSNYGLQGYIHCYQINLAYTCSAPVTLTMNTDQGSFSLTYPPSTGAGGMPSKILLKCPRNKWKVASFTITSSAPVNVFKGLSEVWLKSWGSIGPYQVIGPFGGETTTEAQI